MITSRLSTMVCQKTSTQHGSTIHNHEKLFSQLMRLKCQRVTLSHIIHLPTFTQIQWQPAQCQNTNGLDEIFIVQGKIPAPMFMQFESQCPSLRQPNDPFNPHLATAISTLQLNCVAASFNIIGLLGDFFLLPRCLS